MPDLRLVWTNPSMPPHRTPLAYDSSGQPSLWLWVLMALASWGIVALVTRAALGLMGWW